MESRLITKITGLLLELYDKTFTEIVGIESLKNTPSHLFRLLCTSLLFSTKVNHEIVIATIKAFNKEGLTTARKMLNISHEKRVEILNRSGYARHDQKMAKALEGLSMLLIKKYNGDLRVLREEARENPREERRLLKEFPGIGDPGVNIFFLEVQRIWPEIFPFADERVLLSANKIGLPDELPLLKKLVSKENFIRLIDALILVDLNKDHSRIIKALREKTYSVV